MNFKLDALLPDKTNLSPLSKINFPARKLAESFAGIGKLLTISVVTATPTTLLWCDNETSYEDAPIFAT